MQKYSLSTTQRFAIWAKLKVHIHFSKNTRNIYFREKQIWWASVGQNIGVESNGKNVNFERPVIILKKFNSKSFLTVVLSTKEKTGLYYFPLRHNSGKSFVNLSQLKLMSSKRLIRKIGQIHDTDFELIKNGIKEYL